MRKADQVAQPRELSPAQQNYADMKTPPTDKKPLDKQNNMSSHMLADYCASQKLMPNATVAGQAFMAGPNSDAIQSGE